MGLVDFCYAVVFYLTSGRLAWFKLGCHVVLETVLNIISRVKHFILFSVQWPVF